MDKQNRALLIAVVCIVAFVCVGIFLSYNFVQLDREGVACMSEPLVWAENRMFEDTGESYSCECSPEEYRFGFVVSN